MARKRSLDPDIWADDAVQALPSAGAVMLYIGTISQADDDGRLQWSAQQLWAKIFPGRSDVKLSEVERWMDAIGKKLVRVYKYAGKLYAVHPNWRKHQYVNRPSPSKLPEPPPEPSLFDSVNGSVSDSVSSHVPSDSVSDSDSVPEHSEGSTPSARVNLECPFAEYLRWPADRDIAGMTALAREFISVFSNTRDQRKQNAQLARCTGALTKARSRGATAFQTWNAAADALEANGGKPLFGATIMSLLDYLPRNGATANGRKYDPNAGKMMRPEGETAASKIRVAREPSETRS